ncbi:MAG: GNAT family N-acetyltransferase [Alphaproteobacteria bacterium]
MKELRNDLGERGLAVVVTFLELTSRPPPPGPPRPQMKTAILRCENPPVHFYRYLYDTIGRDYFWVERRRWTDDALAGMLAEPKIELYALYVSGVPAGMSELDFRNDKAAQIAYFGLVPEFVGRKLGPWFLYQTCELAWAKPIEKLIVNTCSLDHPRALQTYQRMGFVPYSREDRTIWLPAGFE